MRIIHTLAVTLAVAVLGSVAAQARPADFGTATASASPFQAVARVWFGAARQDLRSPDGRDAAVRARQDLRSPDGRDAAIRAQHRTPRVAATASAGKTTRSAPSQDGSGADWTAIALTLAGGLLAIGATAGITARRRVRAIA